VDFINFHIAYLLTKHECVIIPDFGAFVVSKAKEDVAKKKGFIAPPANNYLTFNPEIIQDDGLLVHSVAKEKSISDTEALRLVNDYVDNLVNDLRKGQTVQFPWIGKIHLSDDRKIVFTSANNLSCNASNCGLVNFNFPYLTETAEDEFVEKKHKKISKRSIFYILLAAIALLLIALFIFLVPKLDISRFSFSLPSLPTINNPFKTNPVKPTVDTLPFVHADSLKPEIIDSIKPEIIDSVKFEAVDSVKPTLPDSVKAVIPEYYIIVFSTAREKDAEVMLHYFVSSGISKAKIIHSDEKYRISVETFDNQEDAVSFLDMLKKNGENPLFKDAWIFEASR